jgi:hypothetical protein
MGFLLSVRVDLPEDEWRDILTIARRRGVSRLEGLGDLERWLEPYEARALASALQADLEDPAASERPVPRERVEAVVHILGSGEPVHLERTPEWKSGRTP